jgi:DNA mismatch endonuclease (patch repair protein)
MQANRGRDTKPELAVRRILHARGLRYRVGVRPLPGLNRTADIVFPGRRVCVFVDGCFWHGCEQHYAPPKTNRDFWEKKAASNKARDADTDERLRAAGWTIVRAWEHEPPEEIADRVCALVRPVSRNS